MGGVSARLSFDAEISLNAEVSLQGMMGRLLAQRSFKTEKPYFFEAEDCRQGMKGHHEGGRPKLQVSVKD
jgi:hypothetical protein